MGSSRWEFVKAFISSTTLQFYNISVDGEFYDEIGFPIDEEYAAVIETCTCAVESEARYKDRKVTRIWLSVDSEPHRLHLYTVQCKPEDWWTL